MVLEGKLSLPRDKSKLDNIVKPLAGCILTNRQTKEETDGPVVKEEYNCPCGPVILEQKSVIKDPERPETSEEIVRINSTECRI